MSKDSKLNVKKVRRGTRGKHRSVTSRDSEQDAVSGFVIDDTCAARNNELAILGAQLAAKLNVSTSFKPVLRCATSNGIVVRETEKQIASNTSESDADVTQNNTIHSTQLANTSRVSSSRRSEADKHNDTVRDESESTEEERGKNGTTTASTMTDFSEADASSTKDSDIIECESDIENMLDETQETVSKDKSKLRRKMKSEKLKVSRFLLLSKSQKRNSIINQVAIHDKPTKENKKNKIKARAVIATRESIKESILEECRCNSKELIDDNVVTKTKNAQKIEQSSETKDIFSDHIPVDEMKKILETQTSDNILYVKGTLRVNPKYNYYAYLSMEDRERDLFINGITDRNRAFDGDLVVARINPDENWHTFADGRIQKTGTVVCILEEVHPRKVTGYLTHVRKHKSYMIIKPKDQRVPLIRVYSKSLSPLHRNQLNRYKNAICFVNIYCWKQPHYALGKVLSIVGEAGDINAELEAILLENNLDVSRYRQELLQGLPTNDILTDTDIKSREDWRHECIITIDPDTAVDLDDAVSCKVLDNGNYEIGVHISDVTHYLKFFSPLDNEISKRATTVYLPHMSYHMLPEQLCQVCSLLPGKDRLAFSVIWEMTPNAEIVKHRFAKTVIRSCCQMSYDSAQIMIDNPEISSSEIILNIKGNYSVSSLSDIVNNLYKLSVILRDGRFANGALVLDQPKIQICMDSKMIEKCGIPIPSKYYLEERKDSNRLIEEFMLLANMTVAAQLYKAIPKTALLRIHKDPSRYSLTTVYETLQKYGVHLDIETAGALYSSIQRYEQNSECNSSTVNNSMRYIMMVITKLCSKTMARAEYKCASTIPSLCDLKHYALNAPLYTHFTSPIRRYSDCIVHRLLYATIADKPLPKKWTTTLCSRIAANCNLKKYSAKLAQEQSTELFFTYMVDLSGGFSALAVVLDVKERGMDVILCDTGVKLRVYFKDIKDTIATVEYSTDFSVPTITVNWKTPAVVQKINMFSLVRVRVERISETFRLKALLEL